MDILDILHTVFVPILFVTVWVISMHYLVRYLRRFGKGYKFGVQIATHLGMTGEFFFSVMGEGNLLASNETILRKLLDDGYSVVEASIELAPYLEEGLTFYVRDFGKDEAVEKAGPIIAKLIESWQQKQK